VNVAHIQIDGGDFLYFLVQPDLELSPAMAATEAHTVFTDILFNSTGHDI
jgi:hypothetical protein